MGWKFSRWNNEAADVLIGGTYTLDEQTRLDTFWAIGDFINGEVPMIHLFTVPNADAHSTCLAGIQSSVNDLVTWKIADWTLK